MCTQSTGHNFIHAKIPSISTPKQTDSSGQKITSRKNRWRVHNIYFGREKSLRLHRSDSLPDDVIKLELSVNIDGLSILKGSHVSFWPILCNVPNISSEPFPVALFCDKKNKTDNLDYLDDFIQEFKILSTEGIQLNGKLFPLELRCFTCDSPANTMVKATV